MLSRTRGELPGPARVAGYLLACLVHLTPLALLVAGAYLIAGLTLLSVPAGLVVLDLAWVLRPRFGRLPSGAAVLTREDAPRLFALIDRIGTEIGTPGADVVVVSGEVNAAFGTYGLRRRRMIEIGHPLWMILTPAERVSVLAHEMAHSRNGDGRHGLVVGGALHSLAELRQVTEFGWEPGDGVSRLLAESVLALVGLPVRALALVLELLLNRASQRAEHRADEIQARCVPTAAGRRRGWTARIRRRTCVWSAWRRCRSWRRGCVPRGWRPSTKSWRGRRHAWRGRCERTRRRPCTTDRYPDVLACRM